MDIFGFADFFKRLLPVKSCVVHDYGIAFPYGSKHIILNPSLKLCRSHRVLVTQRGYPPYSFLPMLFSRNNIYTVIQTPALCVFNRFPPQSTPVFPLEMFFDAAFVNIYPPPDRYLFQRLYILRSCFLGFFCVGKGFFLQVTCILTNLL